MSIEMLYLRADDIKPGDRLPDVSRFPVSAVKFCPMPTGGGFMRINFDGTDFTRRAFDGGPEYGFECFRVDRGESEE